MLPTKFRSSNKSYLEKFLDSVFGAKSVHCLTFSVSLLYFFLSKLNGFLFRKLLSSLRAESDMAVPGRRCPPQAHSGVGEDFLTRRSVLFTKTAVTGKRKVDPKVPNRPSYRGLQTSPWWNPDFRLEILIFLRKKKWIFWPFFRFSAKCKKGRFSVIPAGTEVRCQYRLFSWWPPSLVD